MIHPYFYCTMTDLRKDHRLLKIFYILCQKQHEKYLNRTNKIPLKREYEEKLRSKEYQKMNFFVFCRSKKIIKHIPSEMILFYFDLKNGMN